MKLKKLLKLWCKNDLISEDQANNISSFMKERRKETFFKVIKWLMIIGTFWVVIGILSLIGTLIDLGFFEKTWSFIVKIFQHLGTFIHSICTFIFTYIISPIVNYIFIPIGKYIILPVIKMINHIFEDKAPYFYYGTITLIISAILFFFEQRLKKDQEIDNLNLEEEQKNVLKSHWILDTAFSIFLALTFTLYNTLLMPSYADDGKMIPIFLLLGFVTFTVLAFKFQKNIYLIFSILFVASSVGLFSGYESACYWIGVSRPILQLFVGIILIGISYIIELKLNIKELKKEDSEKTDYIYEKFSSTYTWSGLFLVFITLWFTSLFGFNSSFGFLDISTRELWFTNILFLASSIGAMFIGAKTEKKIYFHYGLVFLIIESYTVFCARLFDNLPTNIAAILFGLLLIGTGKTIQKVYLKNLKKNK